MTEVMDCLLSEKIINDAFGQRFQQTEDNERATIPEEPKTVRRWHELCGRFDDEELNATEDGSVKYESNGIRTKLFGQRWRRLCIQNDCEKRAEKSGLCRQHLGRSGQKTNIIEAQITIDVNDVLEELSEENNRLLNELLFADKVLTEVKDFFGLICDKIRHDLDENDLQKFENLNEKLSDINTPREDHAQLILNCQSINDQIVAFGNDSYQSDDSFSAQEEEEEVSTDDEDYRTTIEKKGNKYVCRRSGCGFATDRPYKLKDHNNVHTGERPYKCDQCDQTFYSRNILRGHIRDVHKRKQTMSSDDNKDEEWLEDGRVVTKNGKKYVCDWEGCDYVADRPYALNDHKNTHTGEKPYNCPHCNKAFAGHKSRRSHIRSVHEGVKCHGKTREYRTTEENRKKYFCDWIGCEFVAYRPYALSDHKNSHTGERPHECPECGKCFSCRRNLRGHRATHKPDYKPVARKYSYSKRYTCDHPGCEYRAEKPWHLKEHNNIHTGLRPYQCSQCDKTFQQKRSLSGHVKTVHQVLSEPLVCDIDNCGKQFSTTKRFENHQRDNHIREKKFVCHHPGCDFRTIKRRDLEDHQQIHTNERKYVCTFDGCDKTFRLRNCLRVHLLTHRVVADIECTHEGCTEKFISTVARKRHIVRYHSEPYMCEWPGCDYKSHIKASILDHRSRHTKEKSHECPWPSCGKRFNIKNELALHMRRHTGDKRFACHWPGCQYRCVQSNALKKHMRVHNKGLSK